MSMFLAYKEKWRKLVPPARASIVYFIVSFFQSGIIALTTPIFTRLLTTSEYGKYSVFNSWLGIFTCFITLNIYGGVYTQDLVKKGEHKNAVKISYYLLLTILLGIWLVFFFFVRKQLVAITGIELKELLLMFIMIWLSGIFQIWAQAERIEYKYKALFVSSMAYTIFSVALSIGLVVFFDEKVYARILGMVFPALGIYGFIFIMDVLKNKCTIKIGELRHVLILAIPLVPHYLSQIILNNSDRIMIEKMCGASEAGIYSLASSVAQIMSMFNSALLATIEPWVYKKIKECRVEEIRNVAYPALSGIAFVNWLFILMAPEVIKFFAPQSYISAIYTIPPISMSVFFIFSYAFFAFVEFYYEKTSYISIATVLGAIMNIVLNYIFIKKYGYIAAGYTTLICYVIYAALHYCFMKKICKEKEIPNIYSLKTIILIAVAFVGISICTEALYNSYFVRWGILIAIVIVTWVNRKKFINMLRKLKTIG